MSDTKHFVNKLLVALLLIFIPLYPKFPLVAFPGSQVFIRLDDFVIFFAFLVWLINNRDRIISLMKLKISKAVVIFLVVGLMSVLSGYLLTQTVSLPIGLVHWIRRIQYIIPLFIGLTAVKSSKDYYFYIKVIILVILFAFIYGVGQKHFSWPIITTQNQEYSKGIALFFVEGSHLPSTFAGHYDLAAYLVLLAPLVVVLMTARKEILKQLNIIPSVLMTRLLLLGTHISILWLLVNAASRISVAAYLGSVTLSLLLVRKILIIPLILLISIGFILTSSKLMDRYVNIIQVSVNRIISYQVVNVPSAFAQDVNIPERRNEGTSIQETAPPPVVVEDRSTSIRLNIEWPRAIRAFLKNPLLGTGYSSISLATDNDYLRVLGEAGLLGFLSLMLIAGRVVQRTFLVFPIRKTASIRKLVNVSLLSAIPGIMLIMVFIDILESSKFAISFWLLVGIALAKISKGENIKI